MRTKITSFQILLQLTISDKFNVKIHWFEQLSQCAEKQCEFQTSIKESQFSI